MRPEDLPAVKRLHAEQNARDVTNYPLPRIFRADGSRASEVPIALVILNGAEVLQGIAVERTAELMLFGCDPKATAVLHRQIQGLFYLLKGRGYTGLHCQAPKRTSWWRRALYRVLAWNEVIPAIERSLNRDGFVRDDHRLAHFYKEL